MEHGVSFDDICRHFEDDHGAKWTASILHLEETPSDPVSCVLKSSLDAPEKLAMLQILLDGKTWIEECLLLLKQIAAAIEPILNKYHSLYTYCDTLVSSKDCQKILLRRIGTTLPQDTCILLVFPFVTWPIFIFLLLLKHNVPIFSVWVFCSVRLTFSSRRLYTRSDQRTSENALRSYQTGNSGNSKKRTHLPE